MSQQRIIMNYTTPPNSDDLQVIAEAALENMPEEIQEYCDDVVIHVEDIVDEGLENDLDLDDPYDLLMLYRNGSEISPGVQRKIANDDNVLMVYRRPLLDYWCETGDDLNDLVRQVMIEELGQTFEFSDDEIEDMVERPYQGAM